MSLNQIGSKEGLLKKFFVKLDKNATQVEFHRQQFEDDSDSETEEEPQHLRELKLIVFSFDPLKNSFYSSELDKRYDFEETKQVKGENQPQPSIQKSKSQINNGINYRMEDGVILLEDSDCEEDKEQGEESKISEKSKEKTSDVMVVCISDSEINQKSYKESPSVQVDKALQLQNLFRSRIRNQTNIGQIPDSFIPETLRKTQILSLISSLPLSEPTEYEMNALQSTFAKESISDETPDDEYEGLVRRVSRL